MLEIYVVAYLPGAWFKGIALGICSRQMLMNSATAST